MLLIDKIADSVQVFLEVINIPSWCLLFSIHSFFVYRNTGVTFSFSLVLFNKWQKDHYAPTAGYNNLIWTQLKKMKSQHLMKLFLSFIGLWMSPMWPWQCQFKTISQSRGLGRIPKVYNMIKYMKIFRKMIHKSGKDMPESRSMLPLKSQQGPCTFRMSDSKQLFSLTQRTLRTIYCSENIQGNNTFHIMQLQE